MKDVILTGLRANSDLHIGNYFGAMLPLVDMALSRSNEFDINMFIPDLHSFTTPIDHKQLNQQIFSNARYYVAAGLPLNNPSIRLYRQSYVPAHSELTVILNNFVGFGEMERMTQFKDKAAKLSTGRVSVGLFDYPVLMASDILLYNAKYVPVGDDQTQHLEVTRDIAIRFNNAFGDIFVVPDAVAKQQEFFGKDQALRIKDLLDPNKKMSKSDETGKGVIFLNDTPEVARKKIMSATTDDKACVAYDKQSQPGISNLLDILTLARQANAKATNLDEVIGQFSGMTSYGDFKAAVANEVIEFLTKFQNNLTNVDEAQLLAKLESSEATANQIANTTLMRVQIALGLRK